MTPMLSLTTHTVSSVSLFHDEFPLINMFDEHLFVDQIPIVAFYCHLPEASNLAVLKFPSLRLLLICRQTGLARP